jgi:putative heme-binding domain-containing protein
LREGGPVLSHKRYKAEDAEVIADLCLSIPSADAADFLLEHIQSSKQPLPRVSEYARHASRHISETGVAKLTAYIRSNFARDFDQQLSFFKAIQEGAAQRGAQPSTELRDWGGDLAKSLLTSARAENQPWRNSPISGKSVVTNPWFLQARPSADGDKNSSFLSSLPPGGEHLTGALRSSAFEIPKQLSFFIAGHDGPPTQPPQGNNLVRLVEAETGKVLMRSAPPRNDTAQEVRWDLSEFAGRKGYLEIVDGDSGPAYAWLAVGRFQPAVAQIPQVNPNQVSARIQAAADIAKSLRLQALSPQMSELLSGDLVDPEAQAALASSLVALDPNEQRLALAPLLGDSSIPPVLRQKIGRALAQGSEADSLEVLEEAMRVVPARVQLRLAQSLAGSVAGAETLLAMAEKRQASPQVLLDRSVQDKLAALDSASVKERHANLVKDLEGPSEAIQKQMEKLRAAYNPVKANPVDGARVYTQNCAICHQIDGNGALIGPQLDGIGSRGLERILEDIVDPNRNVDVNFRTHILVLKDGDVVSGLFRREEGELVILADSTGKEITIPKKEIESQRQSETSLMPSNVAEIIPEQDFLNLLAFLLSKGVPQGQ